MHLLSASHDEVLLFLVEIEEFLDESFGKSTDVFGWDEGSTYADHSKTDYIQKKISNCRYMNLKNQRTDEDNLSAAWIVISAARTSGKFMGFTRRKFVTGRHCLRRCGLGDLG